MKKSAFTLIELLVVITIIAILAGIALPVYSMIMERGRATADLSNLRQLGIGTIAYLADNNDQIFSNSSGSSSGTATSWPVTLYTKYVPNWLAFKSPFDNRTASNATPSTGTGIPVSYGVNPNILTQTASATPSSTNFDGNTTRYTSPTLLIYMAPNIDITQPNTVAFMSNSTGDQNVQLTIPTTQATSTTGLFGTHAHRSLINALYADAHVSSVTYITYSMTTGTTASAQWQPLYVAPGQTSQ